MSTPINNRILRERRENKMSHYHSHCSHDLKYCSHCDIVYCAKCGREWGQQHYHYTYTTPVTWTWTYNGVPYTVTNTDGSYKLTTTNGTAVTNKSVVSAFYESTKSEDLNTLCSHT